MKLKTITKGKTMNKEFKIKIYRFELKFRTPSGLGEEISKGPRQQRVEK